MGEEEDNVPTIADEISSFLDGDKPENFEEYNDEITDEEFFQGPPDEEEEEKEEKEEESEKGEPEEKEEVQEETKEKEEVEEQEEVVEKKEEIEPQIDPILAGLKEQNELLLARLEKLETPATPAADPVPDKPAAKATPQAENYDFIGDQDLDTILSSKENFNAFLSKVVNNTINTTTENVYRNLPEVVKTQVTQQSTLKTYVDDFYKENADLATVKKTVGAVANEVSSEHPEFTLEQVFTETEARTRKMLGLKKVALGEKPDEKPASKPSGRKPPLPGKSSARKGGAGKQLSVQERHMNDVLD